MRKGLLVAVVARSIFFASHEWQPCRGSLSGCQGDEQSRHVRSFFKRLPPRARFEVYGLGSACARTRKSQHADRGTEGSQRPRRSCWAGAFLGGRTRPPRSPGDCRKGRRPRLRSFGCRNTAAGATLHDGPEAIFSRADMIVKVKEPLPSERKLLRSGQVLFTYLHLAADLDLTRDL